MSGPEATPLYARLAAANRLIEIGGAVPQTSSYATNILPEHMTNAELIQGISWLATRLYSAGSVGVTTSISAFLDTTLIR